MESSFKKGLSLLIGDDDVLFYCKSKRRFQKRNAADMLGQVIGKSLARIQTGQNTDKRNPDLDGREKPVQIGRASCRERV